MDEEMCKLIVCKILVGINHMHQYGITHGNINPHSIYINKEFDVRIVKIGFGFNYESVKRGLIGDYNFYPI